LFTTKDIAKTTFIANEYDRLTLSEFVDIDKNPVILHWGDLEAAPSSRNYRQAEFRQNQFKALSLQVGTRRLPIRNFYLYVSTSQLRPFLFITDDIRYASIQRILAGLPPESTVYLDQIVIEAGQGDALQFPGAFAFNIGREPDYELRIEEIAATESPDIVEIDRPEYQVFRMTGYPLTTVLSQLLEINSDQLVFDDLESDPILFVEFTSAHHTVGEGKNLILRKLQEQYRFSYRISN
jgi:hypothetical protein